MEKTPKGTKPNTQHRTTQGRYASYDEANRALHAYLVEHDVPIKSLSIMRRTGYFTLRIDSRVVKE